MNDSTCSIPEHEWLVIELDDALDSVDPMGLVGNRPRAHEYQPEIPDLVRMIANGTLTPAGVRDVFVRFFSESMCNGEHMVRAHDCVKEVADRWHAYVDRSNRSWHGSGLLWKSISVQPVDEGERAGTWEAVLLHSTVGYIKDRFEQLEGCTTLDQAVQAALGIDHDYYEELTLHGEEG